MAMGRTMAKAQPQKGMFRSSRFTSVACGVASVCVHSVSQALWCFTSRMHGLGGMLSSPRTCTRMPQATFSHHKAMRVQQPMMKSKRRGSVMAQATASESRAQTSVMQT